MDKSELAKLLDEVDDETLQRAIERKKRRDLEQRVYEFMTEMHRVAVNNVYRYRHESTFPPSPMFWLGMNFWPNHQNFESMLGAYNECILTTLTEAQAAVLMLSVFDNRVQGTIKTPRMFVSYRFDFRGDGWAVLETKVSR